MATPTSDISLGEVIVSGKGAKTIPLSSGGAPIVWHPGPLRVVFRPSAFQQPDASRVNICFAASDAESAYLQQVDLAIIKLIADDPKKYLGAQLTYEQIRERYQSAIKVSDRGYPNLKAKMNLAGSAAVRCWNADKTARGPPQDWTMADVSPRLHIKGLWVMAREFGLLVEMTDALVEDRCMECPF